MATPSPAKNIIALRQWLAEHLPPRRLTDPPRQHLGRPTGLASLDELLEGGLPQCALTEIIAARPSGTGLALLSILRSVSRQGQWSALIDGCDSFSPDSLDNETLRSLLWVRCQNASQSFRAADLLLADGNVPLLILDLRFNPRRSLQKTPSSTWYRLQRLVERSSTSVLVLTPQAMVSSARLRVAVHWSPALQFLDRSQDNLSLQLKFELTLRRLVGREEWTSAAAG